MYNISLFFTIRYRSVHSYMFLPHNGVATYCPVCSYLLAFHQQELFCPKCPTSLISSRLHQYIFMSMLASVPLYFIEAANSCYSVMTYLVFLFQGQHLSVRLICLHTFMHIVPYHWLSILIFNAWLMFFYLFKEASYWVIILFDISSYQEGYLFYW